jgi:Putative transposase DNA-binding domain
LAAAIEGQQKMEQQTKKYQFGGFGVIDNEDLAIAQMRSRNALWNELVALDKVTRTEYNAIVNVDNPAHDRLQLITTEITGLRDDLLMLRVPPALKAEFRERQAGIKESRTAGLSKAELKKLKTALERDIKKFKDEMNDGVKAAVAEFKQTIDALKKEREDIKPLEKATAQANKEKFAVDITAFNEKRKAAIKALYARACAGYTDERGKTYAPLFWKNTSNVIKLFNTARTKAMKEKAALQFHRFDGTGRVYTYYHIPAATDEQKAVAVKYEPELTALHDQRRAAKDKKVKQELSGKITALEMRCKYEQGDRGEFTEVDLFTSNPDFFIDPVDLKRDSGNPTVWDKSIPRGERRRRMRTVAHVSIGGGNFVSVPIILHRPFPLGCVIKEAGVNRKKVGKHFYWSVDFTVKYEEIVGTAENLVAVDLGWAKDSLQDADGRIRVAGVRVKADGRETFKEFCLPASFSEYTKKLNDIQALRDTKTLEAFEALSKFNTDEIPLSIRELLMEAKKSATARKAFGKEPPVHHLRSALWILRKSGEVCAVGGVLECWYERWNHLNEWLVNGRQYLVNFKKDFYRRKAYALAQQAGTLLMDADNFAKMAKTPVAESEKKKIKGDLRQIAAPSMFRDALEQVFARTLYATELWSSRTCAKCEHRNEELGASRTFTCAECGYTDDRESNATKNIMNAFIANPGRFSANRRVAEKVVNAKEEEVMSAVLSERLQSLSGGLVA